MNLQKNVKKLDIVDIGLTKWSAIFFPLFIASAWPAFTSFVVQTHWSWFLAISLLLAIRPTYRFLKE